MFCLSLVPLTPFSPCLSFVHYSFTVCGIEPCAVSIGIKTNTESVRNHEEGISFCLTTISNFPTVHIQNWFSLKCAHFKHELKIQAEIYSVCKENSDCYLFKFSLSYYVPIRFCITGSCMLF
jgi:hypothetical protein